MPYSKDNPPDKIKNLPAHAQDIWMSAYNLAYKEYPDDEARCNKIAWAAVKNAGYKQDAKGAWIKAEMYIKDILYVGKFPHPQDEKQIINMTEDLLRAIADNSKRFLDAGGKIPLTVSHPKKEEEKIASTEGYVEDVFIRPEDGRLCIRADLGEKAVQWIKDGKLQSVSPGIFNEVLTSVGKFPILIDHVALTASPHLIGQGNFIPITASSYSGGAVYFENNAVSFEISLWERIQNWLERNLLHQGGKKDNEFTEEGGNDMELKELQDRIAKLEAEGEAGKKNAAKLKADLEAANKTIEDYQAKNKAAQEQAAADEKKQFEARVDKLITELKVPPASREALVAQYEQLKTVKVIEFEGKKHLIADFILSRYDVAKPKDKTEIPADKMQFMVEKEIVDLNTPDGKDKLFEITEKCAEKIALERKIYDYSFAKYPDIYAEAKVKILAEHEKPAEA